ncbi:MAG: glucose-1-phosphate cytidylyltransferase [Candidatus Altiarchaeota archaeon]|nr:glucose-1-phosphate cytidylyltransferase [Candidatus Altiarchaeota archaeon]
MKVVILCGGLGTRLREQTEFIPKPMVPVGNRPILWHIMKIYYHQGFNEFILPLGYKGDVIKDYFVNYKWKSSDFTLEMHKNNRMEFHDEQKCENWTIHFIDTGVHTKTAKRVQMVKKLLTQDKQFMLTYGDGVADIRLDKLLQYHDSKGLAATMSGFRPKGRFGLVEEKDGVVKRFKEKPVMDDWANCGFMVFQKKALEYFTEKDVMLETDVLPKIAKDKQLAVYPHEGSWHYMDTQRDYEELNRLWGKTPTWKTWKD